MSVTFLTNQDREEIHETYATKEELINTEAIAKGRATGYVFDTVGDMNTWLGNPENAAILVLGDNLYIRATEVPDYWWDGETAQPLETQKVDLTEYARIYVTPISYLIDDTGEGAKYIRFAYGADHALNDKNLNPIHETYATKTELNTAIGEALEGEY